MGIFKRLFSSWIFLYSLFSIIVLGGTFYLVLGQGVKDTVTQQLLAQKRTIARAEVGNISTFFEKFGNSIATLAQLSSTEETRDTDIIHDLDTYMEQRRKAGIISGVVLTDKNGIVRFNSNVLGTRDVGGSIANRDYFLWAKTKGEEGEYFISQPVVSQLGASKGQIIVVVASPVIINNKFSGVVAAAVKMEFLATHFFGLMKISDLTEVYLVDGSGNLLYSNFASNKIGSNISELFSDDLVLSDKIKNALGATVGDQFATEQRLIAYSPLILKTQKWLFIVSSSPQEIVNLTKPLYIRQISIFALTATTILLFGALTTVKKNQS